MEQENDRQEFLAYWKQFNGADNINGMMLNANAVLFEESDREDVCVILPDLTGKSALDAGAGIGRFTAELAVRAQKISASDFIPEYVRKLHLLKENAERAGKEMEVTTADATHLSYPEKSFFLVFTNWLFMYFNNIECIKFSLNALKWAENNGYFKLRESCSEPSTGRVANKKETSLHAAVNTNPTAYRFSSVYIKLIEAVRFVDNDGKKWKFVIEACGSIPTYIECGNNWRQVQLIAKKVQADDSDIVLDEDSLKQLFANDWVESQKERDSIIDNVKTYFADEIFTKELRNYISQEHNRNQGCVFVYQSSENPWYMRVGPFSIVPNVYEDIWTNECDPELFRCSLTAANERKNKQYFFTYTKDNIFYALDYVAKRKYEITNFLSVDYLSHHDFSFYSTFKNVADKYANMFLLESYTTEEEKIQKLNKLALIPYFHKSVTDAVHDGAKKVHQDISIQNEITSKKWMLVTVHQKVADS
uniref:phosphoethanolamine N-methyltransferase n=1 Tax=Parastrongyloides trichosuri TaxID=131310 RepID=A0A0N4Z7Z1_PARTI